MYTNISKQMILQRLALNIYIEDISLQGKHVKETRYTEIYFRLQVNTIK